MRRSTLLVAAVANFLWIALAASAETSPIAVDDYVESDGGTTHIYVLANDLGDLDPSTLTILSSPTLGSATVIATGSPKIKYNASGSGTDIFGYSICSAAGVCSMATVTVNIGVVVTTSTTDTTIAVTSTTTDSSTTQTTSSVVSPPVDPSSTTAPPTDPVVTTVTSPRVDPLAELALESDQTLSAAGTTVGEPRRLQFDEDIRFLGRSGADTIRLIAVPAVMVSGLIGFLLIGLPQNALATILGFLVGMRRRAGEKETTSSGV